MMPPGGSTTPFGILDIFVTDVIGHPRDNGRRGEVEVVVAHNERATLRVGDVFLAGSPPSEVRSY